jgi:hypothetical protein
MYPTSIPHRYPTLNSMPLWPLAASCYYLGYCAPTSTSKQEPPGGRPHTVLSVARRIVMRRWPSPKSGCGSAKATQHIAAAKSELPIREGPLRYSISLPNFFAILLPKPSRIVVVRAYPLAICDLLKPIKRFPPPPHSRDRLRLSAKPREYKRPLVWLNLPGEHDPRNPLATWGRPRKVSSHATQHARHDRAPSLAPPSQNKK